MQQKTKYHELNGISVVNLSGTHMEMGIQYGEALRGQLSEIFQILYSYYVENKGIPYETVVERAWQFYDRYSYTYKVFIKGVSKGSGLDLDQCVILNAMETLNALVREENRLSYCAFLSLPPEKSKTGQVLIGRNYDFPPPFDKASKYLIVTVLNEKDKVPSAFIGMPGQIYCPSCVNSEGLFIELNNGMPSGGYYVNQNRETLLIELLEVLQNSDNLEAAKKQLNAIQSDYSLIINTANQTNTKSFEFSSTLGMKHYFPKENEVFASTNFYLNKTWKDIPPPTDNTTWLGVTRRNNLLKLANTREKFSVSDFKGIMEVKIEDGGAVWDFTIYQIIFDSSNLTLYLRSNHYEEEWTMVPLKDFFFGEINRQKATKENPNYKKLIASSKEIEEIFPEEISEGDKNPIHYMGYSKGAWDDYPETNPATGDSVYTYRVFNEENIELGAIRFYKHPMLCENEEIMIGNIHNSTGMLSGLNVDLNNPIFKNMCSTFPSAMLESMLDGMKKGAKLGVFQGLRNSIQYYLEQSGVSQNTAETRAYFLYYTLLFTDSFIRNYSSQESVSIDGVQEVLNALWTSSLETGTIFLVQTATHSISNFLGEYAVQLKENGQTISGKVCEISSYAVDAAVYAYSAKDSFISATAGFFSGAVASWLSTKVGEKIVDKVMDADDSEMTEKSSQFSV